MKKILIGFILAISLLNIGYTQSQVGAVWLLIPVSPTLNGMGDVGVGLPSEDIYAGYYNPANGIYGYRGLSFALSNYKTGWLPDLVSDIYLHHSVIGFNLIPERLPFQITLSNYRTLLDLGELIWIDEYGNELGTFHSSMTAEAYSLAARYHDTLFKIPVDLSVGATRKRVIQDFSKVTSRNTFYDAGALVSFPLKYNFNDGIGVKITPAAGYSISNIGDKITIIDPAFGDPAPRYARAGLSLSLNLIYDDYWNLIAYRQARSAGDILIKSRDDSTGTFIYQDGLGDIDPVKNVLNYESDEDVAISWGQEITFLDLFSVRLGQYIDISGNLHERSSGYSIYSTGFFRLLGHTSKMTIFNRCADYLTISYNYAKLMNDENYYNTRSRTEFKSLTFSLNNVDQIFWPDKREGKSFNKRENPFFLITGLNVSDVRIRDKEIAKTTHVKVRSGAKIGLESRFGPMIIGAELDQRGANYKYLTYLTEYDFPLYLKIRDIYNYFSFYGLLSYPLLPRLRIFGGLEAGDCISRTATAEFDWGDDSDEDTEDVPPVNFNWDYGLKAGVDIMIFRSFGIRAAYYHGMNYIFEYTDLLENCKNRSGEISLIYKL